MKEHKFKVGDRVIGNSKANKRYNHTKAGWKGVVTKINGSTMEVLGDDKISFGLYPEFFDLDVSEPVKVEVSNYEIY